MKTKNILGILAVVVLSACGGHNQDGYKIYKTFDEYAMKEIPFGITEKVSLPYAMVKRVTDTIWVKLCFADTTENRTITYINKGNYWYNLNKYQVEPALYYTTLCDTVPIYTERYIQKDTIWEYQYDIENLILRSTFLSRNTRNNEVYISIPDSLNIPETNRLDSIKNFIVGYPEKYPYYTPKKIQIQNYLYYNKVLRNDTLYIYEKPAGTNYKLGKLRDVYKMTNLGVIDIHAGGSVFYNAKVPRAE